MKTLLITIFSAIMLNCMAQNDLTVSKVIYIPLKAGSASNFIVKDTTVIIPPGKIWEITNVKIAITYDNRILGTRTYLYIDEQIIAYSNVRVVQNTDPIWLPEGEYRITLRTEEENQTGGRFIYTAFLSGIEYNLK